MCVFPLLRSSSLSGSNKHFISRSLLNNISETMTKPLGIQATAHRFEVTFPSGPLKVDIEERNKMCVVCQVNNTVEGFPLCANDIIVSDLRI